MKSRTYTPPHPLVQEQWHRNGAIDSLTVGGVSHLYQVTAVPENKRGDYVHPNAFRYDIERTTSFDGSKSEIELSHGTYTPQPIDINRNMYYYGWPQSRASAPQALQVDWLRVGDAALADLYEKVRRSGGLNLAVDFAERTQVLGMVNGAKKALGRIVNSSPDRRAKRMLNGRPWVRSRGRWVPVPQEELVKMSAQKYLEYTYGWSPLFNSIYGVFHNIMSGLVSGVVTLRGRAKDRSSSVLWSDYQGVKRAYMDVLQQSWRCQYICQFDLTPSVLTVLAQYTSLNPIAIAWERVPYSFVVDWFYNIGGYLETAESALLYANRFRGGIVSYSYKAERNGTIAGSTTYANSLYPNSSWSRNLWAQATSTRVQLDRQILASYPFPRLPRLRVDMGARRMLNAASLIAQKVL